MHHAVPPVFRYTRCLSLFCVAVGSCRVRHAPFGVALWISLWRLAAACCTAGYKQIPAEMPIALFEFSPKEVGSHQGFWCVHVGTGWRESRAASSYAGAPRTRDVRLRSR